MKVVTFGEIMLRLASEGYLRLLQEPRLQATFGGGEANVAVSLANFGVDVEFVGKLPANDIGDCAVRELNSFGVGTSYIARGGQRVGIYYLEKGASMRPSKVIYDRAGSAFAEARADNFDWNSVFENAEWFHFTGITPALSENIANITETALKYAKTMGLKVSCDINYRNKLWSKESARKTMGKLMKYVDVCICNEEDAFDVFGISAAASDATTGKINKQAYAFVAEKLVEKFGFDAVAITLRESVSANDNNWSAMLYKNKKAYFSKNYPVHIVDRVGGGDSFGAGLIYALLNGYNEQTTLEFAVAASALKHTVEGDFNRVSVNEVNSLMKGNATGRVQR